MAMVAPAYKPSTTTYVMEPSPATYAPQTTYVGSSYPTAVTSTVSTPACKATYGSPTYYTSSTSSAVAAPASPAVQSPQTTYMSPSYSTNGVTSTVVAPAQPPPSPAVQQPQVAYASPSYYTSAATTTVPPVSPPSPELSARAAPGACMGAQPQQPTDTYGRAPSAEWSSPGGGAGTGPQEMDTYARGFYDGMAAAVERTNTFYAGLQASGGGCAGGYGGAPYMGSNYGYPPGSGGCGSGGMPYMGSNYGYPPGTGGCGPGSMQGGLYDDYTYPFGTYQQKKGRSGSRHRDDDSISGSSSARGGHGGRGSHQRPSSPSSQRRPQSSHSHGVSSHGQVPKKKKKKTKCCA